MDSSLSGDGGEEWVGRVRYQQANESGSLSAERPGNVAGLETQTLGRLKDRAFSAHANSALPSLPSQCPGGGRRRNACRLGNLFERYGATCHRKTGSVKITKIRLHNRLC